MVWVMKDEIRKKALSLRNALSGSDRRVRSQIICQKLIDTREYKNAKNIMLYMSFKSEVETDFLLAKAILDGKNVCLPKVISDTEMIAVSYTGETEKGRWSIDEPVGETVNPENIDMLVVPGAAFDKEGNRIGYGKGYYDRFLQNTHGYTVGLAFDFQVFDNIPAEKTDVKIQSVITG